MRIRCRRTEQTHSLGASRRESAPARTRHVDEECRESKTLEAAQRVQWRKDQGGMVSGLSRTQQQDEPAATESIPQTAVHDPQSGHDGPAEQRNRFVSLSSSARRRRRAISWHLQRLPFLPRFTCLPPTLCKHPTTFDDNTLPYLEVNVVQGQSCPEVL